MASRPPLSRRHCSASTPPKCLPSGSVSTPLLSRACVGTASSEALAAGRRIRAAAPQTWLALRGGPDAKDLAADGGDRKFESISLQQTVCLSPAVVFEGREPGFPRGSGLLAWRSGRQRRSGFSISHQLAAISLSGRIPVPQ